MLLKGIYVALKQQTTENIIIYDFLPVLQPLISILGHQVNGIIMFGFETFNIHDGIRHKQLDNRHFLEVLL